MRPHPLFLILIAHALLALTGCSLEPRVIGAQLTADPTQPGKLAEVSVDVKIEASDFANDRARLDRVTLSRREGYDEEPALDLDLAFPDGFDPHLRDGHAKTTSLVNQGTTNSDLAPLCGETLDLQVWLGRDGASSEARVSPRYTLDVSCPRAD